MTRFVFVAALVIGCSSSSQNVIAGEDAEIADAGHDGKPKPLPTLCESVPDPLAFVCDSDEACLGHKCSSTYGHCIWPCASNCDCAFGYHCEAPACRPN